MALLKVGDKVRIIENTSNGFRKGTQNLVIVNVDKGDTRIPYNVQNPRTGDTMWHKQSDVALMEKKPTVCFKPTPAAKTKKTGFTVDEKFIKEAHGAACSEWKQKLEKKFPEVFASKFFKFNEEHVVSISCTNESPLFVANGLAASTELQMTSLMVADAYEMSVIDKSGNVLAKYPYHTSIAFTKKR